MLNQPFFASGNIATAGGCMASQYLAAWLIAKAEGPEAAKKCYRLCRTGRGEGKIRGYDR
ncbi:MAG: thiJ/PfpI family protein [Osedax symbiont Rs1]|nr:MAG: thiJ/PfpI family protein [Osedax symbiont Rs1]